MNFPVSQICGKSLFIFEVTMGKAVAEKSIEDAPITGRKYNAD